MPQALLRVKTIQTPDSLPKYLNDDEVMRLREVIQAETSAALRSRQRRQALFDRAMFYVLWHGGLRLGEVEELRLEDLDLPG